MFSLSQRYPHMSLASIDLPLIYIGQVTLYGNLTHLISYLHYQTTILLVMTFGVPFYHLFVSILLSDIGQIEFYANLVQASIYQSHVILALNYIALTYEVNMILIRGLSIKSIQRDGATIVIMQLVVSKYLKIFHITTLVLVVSFDHTSIYH